MINITDKHQCCGCNACVQACPKGCITMRADAEGFGYPEADAALCIGCGLCEKVCPQLGGHEAKAPTDTLAVKNRNELDRMDSSSGGVFIALARQVLGDGGAVFGAVFDGDWQVEHVMADTLDGVRRMMGSKYVQSRICDTYKQAKACLEQGREVLFAGTPCQVAGLRSYLRRGYANLTAVDIMCHGVPSPAVWRQYLGELAAGSGGVADVAGVDFRDKRREGWSRYNVVVTGANGGKGGCKTELSATVYADNPFMRGFLADAYLRPSCHRCAYKRGASGSDLTIGDYWGARSAVPDFADDKGVSLVFVNTAKGREALGKLDIDAIHADASGEERHNGGLGPAAPERRCRRKFFAAFAAGAGFSASLEAALREPAYKPLLRRLRKAVHEKLSRIIRQ